MAKDTTTNDSGILVTSKSSTSDSNAEQKGRTSEASTFASESPSEETASSGNTGSSGPAAATPTQASPTGPVAPPEQSTTSSTQPATPSSIPPPSTDTPGLSASMTDSSNQNPVSAAETTSSSIAANSSSMNSATNAGALAGGIIGAFFGGAILALMAAYVFDQRRKRSYYRSGRSKSVEPFHAVSTRRSLGPAITMTAWERLIPQSVDDETMTSTVKSLLDRVALHVDNFYARKSLTTAFDLKNLAKVDSKLLPYPLQDLIMDPNMQSPTIKHCIAFALTSSIVAGNGASNKILPIYLAVLPHKLASNSDSDKDTNAARQAYAVWRTLTSSLLPKLADEPILAEHRQQVTETLINDISSAFRDCEVTSNEENRAEQNLAEIIGVAFNVGMRISSQACGFEFEWQHRRRQGTEDTEGFVVLPGFNKVADERGHALGSTQNLVRPTVHRLRRNR